VQGNADVEPGERWAYRERQVDELVEVMVLRLGRKNRCPCWSGLPMMPVRNARSGCRPSALKGALANVALFRERE